METWTLPKREAGAGRRDWEGCGLSERSRKRSGLQRFQLKSFAGKVSYNVKGTPKVVTVLEHGTRWRKANSTPSEGGREGLGGFQSKKP